MAWQRDTPWRQGHLLTVESAEAMGLRHSQGKSHTLVIVASHDCDLAQPPECEPIVELIVGHRIEQIDGNYSHAKNSRRLHISLDGQDACNAEFEATAKVAIKKESFADSVAAPCSQVFLTPETRKTFQKWLASRYRRSSFPNEFDRRLKDSKAANKLSKLLKGCGDHVVGIFFDVDEGGEVIRVGDDDTYKLDIHVMHAAVPDFKKSLSVANDLATKIKSLFHGTYYEPTKIWQQIELRECDPVSESTITYEQFKMLNPWRFEHMSLGAEPQQDVLPE